MYLIVLLAPMIYGGVSGNEDFFLLTDIFFPVGLVCLLAYLGCSAYRERKKQKSVMQEIRETYGDESVLTVCIEDSIRYQFHTLDKEAAFCEVGKIVELEMYLLLHLKNGVVLPVWKLGFTEGEWNDFIPYVQQRISV